MSLTQRRIIYFFFIGIFVIVGPILLLYASGFRYNFRLNVWQKRGGITIDSNPEDARVYVNGSLFPELTPAIVANLIPQEVEIVVAQEGYYDWRRNVTVRSAETVFLTDIELFRRDVAPQFVEMLPDGVDQLSNTSTTTQVGVYTFSIVSGLESDRLVRQSVFGNSTTLLTSFPHSSYRFISSVDGTLGVLDEVHLVFYAFRLSDDVSRIEQREIVSPVNGVDWRPDGGALLYFNDYELWVVDLFSGEKHLITRVSTGIDRALWHESGRYIIYQNGDDIKIVEFDQSQDRQHYQLTTLPNIRDMAYDSDTSILYVLAEVGNQDGWFALTIQ